MALTVTPDTKGIGASGHRREVVGTITFDSSYPTGGEPITVRELGLTSHVDFIQFEPGPGGHVIGLDRANLKLKAFNGTTEIANATNLSTVVVKYRALGV